MKFTLRSNQKPLMAILDPKNDVPPIAAMRMQRWATRLCAYVMALDIATQGNTLMQMPYPVDHNQTSYTMPRLI